MFLFLGTTHLLFQSRKGPCPGYRFYQVLVSKTWLSFFQVLDTKTWLSTCNFGFKSHVVLHANGQDMLLWVLRSIEMYFSCNYLQRGDLTTRQISSGGGNKGVVDLWMFKKEVASHFLGSFVDDHVDNAEIRKAIRLAMQDHCSHRSLFGWAMDEQQPDLTWHAGWKESERQVLFLAEAGFEGLRIIGIFACSSLFYFFWFGILSFCFVCGPCWCFFTGIDFQQWT